MATILQASLTPLSVTVATAAQLLGFKDTKSVYALIRQGKIRRIGKNVVLMMRSSLCGSKRVAG